MLFRSTGRSYRPRSTCTTEPVPGPAVQADARRLGGVADRLTVYVIRQHWNDASGLLTLTAADRAAVELLPGSFARLRLPPGHYRLRLDSAGEAGALDIGGLAGEVRVLEVDSEVWAWRRSDRLREVRADTQLERVSRLPLVADVR